MPIRAEDQSNIYVGADDPWITRIDPSLRAAQLLMAGLSRVQEPRPLDFNTTMMALGRQSDNVQGPVEQDEPAAVMGRQNRSDFNTDRMTEYDPYAEQRRQQAIQIANALSGQGANPTASGVKDMRRRAGMEFLLQQMQGWHGNDPSSADLIPNNFRQRMFGRY